jgi:UDP-MurNAc hydroxylase
VRVRYIYSACVVIETPDVRILCDPWFTAGAYDGSWFQWPEISNPIDVIGPTDLIFISHIHPDHYDPNFLRHYRTRYPQAKIVIGRQSPPVLEARLREDGFEFETCEQLSAGSTSLAILPNKARRVNIDTALVVTRAGRSVANLNDNPFDPEQVAAIRRLCDGGPTLALLPYGGATAHPQTYIFASEAELTSAANAKERHFLDIFQRYIAELAPSAVLPFAGKYWLGGPLAALNRYRGIPDPVAAAGEAGGQAFVLADGGHAFFDLDSMTPSEVRLHPYDLAEVSQHLASLDFTGYAYEREIRPDPNRAFPFRPLLNSALRRARERLPVAESCWVCLRPRKASAFYCFDPASTEDVVVLDGAAAIKDLTPRIEIYVDDRYLFGLLSRLYHWNNALIGSHLTYRRTPDEFRRDVFHFLDFLQV